MERFNLKVQSVSDIITNSSTEVFMVYDENSMNNIKDLVNAILSLSGSNKTFDDLFTYEINFDEEYLLEVHPEYKKYKRDELLQKAYEFDDDYSHYPCVNGYKIIAKNSKNEEVAEILSKIDKIFNTYARYC